jgi:hypothetical protein
MEVSMSLLTLEAAAFAISAPVLVATESAILCLQYYKRFTGGPTLKPDHHFESR